MISFALYLFLIVSYFLHLTSRLPWLGAIRFDFILMGLVLVSALMERKQEGEGKDHSTRFLWMIIAYVFLSLPLVLWPGSVLRAGVLNYLKVVVFYFFTVSIIRNEKQLKVFIFVFLACAIFRFLEPAYLHVTAGYWGGSAMSIVGGKLDVLRRMAGAPSDVINANQLAWVVVSTIPFLYYIGWHGNGFLKILTAAVAALGIYVFIRTGSRTGMVSLIVTVFAILFMGEKKVKRTTIGLIFLIPVVLIIVGNMHPLLKTRYLSTVESGLPGSETAAGRIRGLKEGIGTLGARVIVGHGLGTSLETNANLSGSAQPSHNLYLETTQELGLIGLTLFLMYVRGIWRNLRDAKSAVMASESGNRWLISLANAVQVWVIMDLVYSIACFGLNSWEWYFFGGVSVAILRLAWKEEKLKAAESISPPNRYLSPTSPDPAL